MRTPMLTELDELFAFLGTDDVLSITLWRVREADGFNACFAGFGGRQTEIHLRVALELLNRGSRVARRAPSIRPVRTQSMVPRARVSLPPAVEGLSGAVTVRPRGTVTPPAPR